MREQINTNRRRKINPLQPAVFYGVICLKVFDFSSSICDSADPLFLFPISGENGSGLLHNQNQHSSFIQSSISIPTHEK